MTFGAQLPHVLRNQETVTGEVIAAVSPPDP
jgi:hypothetical protein